MFTTIGVHDPIPDDIEVNRYEHEGEDRIRVGLKPDRPTQGFGGIGLYGKTEDMVTFLVAMLAKVVDKPTTIELEGEAGEYAINPPPWPHTDGVPWPADHRGEPRSPL